MSEIAKRPAPADFVELTKTMSLIEIGRHYGVGHSIVARWYSEAGKPPLPDRRVQRRPMPADFVALAATMYNADLRKHYGVSDTLVSRWRDECGVVGPTLHKAPPPDFVAFAATCCQAEAVRRLGVGYRVLKRWAEETGAVFAPAPRPTPPPRRPASPKPHSWGFNGPKSGRLEDHRPSGLATEAQTFMQRQGWRCWRVDDRGDADPKGRRFRCGRRVLSEDQLIAKAQAKGFQWSAMA